MKNLGGFDDYSAQRMFEIIGHLGIFCTILFSNLKSKFSISSFEFKLNRSRSCSLKDGITCLSLPFSF